MAEFRLTQISDTHLTRNFPKPTENFRRVSEHVAAARPDLVVNTGDVSWDGPNSRADMEFALELHNALPADCRYIPGNHDIGDNPTAVGVTPSCLATEEHRDAFVSVFGEDRWQFEAANWRFIGLNSLIMNTGIPSELEQEEWLTSQLEGAHGKPIALFLHKPLFLYTPGDPEEAATSIRFVPQPVRARLAVLLGAYDIRLVASGHVHQRRDFTHANTRHIWAPSVGFIVPDRMQDVIGVKETGLVEYRFRPESFEVRHVRAAGQIDISLDDILAR
jgi:3',5'-cyclic AMP phosphodiesterase CpdA